MLAKSVSLGDAKSDMFIGERFTLFCNCGVRAEVLRYSDTCATWPWPHGPGATAPPLNATCLDRLERCCSVHPTRLIILDNCRPSSQERRLKTRSNHSSQISCFILYHVVAC